MLLTLEGWQQGLFSMLLSRWSAKRYVAFEEIWLSQDACEAHSIPRKPGQHSAELTAIGKTRFASFSYCRGGRRVDM